MPSKRKFYRQVFHVVVLTEDAPLDDDCSLEDIAREIEGGDSSGVFNEVSQTELTGPQMALALIEQGSDPEFFQLDENGEDLDSEDEEDDEDDEDDEEEDEAD